MLLIGAPGQLLMNGELDDVLPVDDSTLLDQANPVGADKRISLDPALIEAREDAMVKALLQRGQLAVVILGGAHDLSNNVRSFKDQRVEYLTVVGRRYQQVADGESRR